MTALAAPTFMPTHSLAESPRIRLATMFLLYLAQGLPVGLFSYALPAWLAQNDASAAAIGTVLAMAALPWTFKLAYGPIMDRYAFLSMGRRRPWVIAGQFVLVVALVTMALVNPGVGQISLIAGFAFLTAFASAVQDVAVDGMAIDVLPKEEIERVNGFMFGGQTIGVALSAGLGGYLAAWYGLPSALLFMAAITAAILVLVLSLRERPGERLLPWTRGCACSRSRDMHLGAFGPIFRQLFKALFTRETMILVPALIAVTTAQGIFVGMAPIFSADVLGWENDTYSSWSSIAKLLSGITAVVLFGWAATRWGARRMFIVCGLIAAGGALAMLVLKGWWTNPNVLIAMIFIYGGVFALRGVTAGSVAMRLCEPTVAATQFSVYMACLNLGTTLGGLMLGTLDAIGGISAMLTAMVFFSLLAATLAAIVKVGR